MLVFAKDYIQAQVLSVYISSWYIVWFDSNLTPFKEKGEQRLVYFNEFIIIVICLHLIC